jgi:hypothetical protein
LPSQSLANGGGRLMVLATSSAETSCATSCALLWKREKHKDSSGRPVGLSGRETTGVHFMAGDHLPSRQDRPVGLGRPRGSFREPRHITRSRRPPWRLRTGAGAPGSRGRSRLRPASSSGRRCGAGPTPTQAPRRRSMIETARSRSPTIS